MSTDKKVLTYYCPRCQKVKDVDSDGIQYDTTGTDLRVICKGCRCSMVEHSWDETKEESSTMNNAEHFWCFGCKKEIKRENVRYAGESRECATCPHCLAGLGVCDEKFISDQHYRRRWYCKTCKAIKYEDKVYMYSGNYPTCYICHHNVIPLQPEKKEKEDMHTDKRVTLYLCHKCEKFTVNGVFRYEIGGKPRCLACSGELAVYGMVDRGETTPKQDEIGANPTSTPNAAAVDTEPVSIPVSEDNEDKPWVFGVRSEKLQKAYEVGWNAGFYQASAMFGLMAESVARKLAPRMSLEESEFEKNVIAHREAFLISIGLNKNTLPYSKIFKECVQAYVDGCIQGFKDASEM